MHPTVLATRNGAAQARIKLAAQKLSEKLDLSAELAALERAAFHDQQVSILFEREAIANLLEAAALKISPVVSATPIISTPIDFIHPVEDTQADADFVAASKAAPHKVSSPVKSKSKK